jgi:glycine cleavage system H lipoate-binding protein
MLRLMIIVYLSMTYKKDKLTCFYGICLANKWNILTMRIKMTALFVVLTFILFILIDILVLRAQKKKHPAFDQSSVAVFNKRSFILPERLYISPGHTWVQKLSDGLVKIGIDDFALKALGELSIINLMKENTNIKKGDVALQAAFGRKKISFRSPIDGVVKSENKEIVGKLLNDPYKKGWGLIISPTNLEENLKSLRTGDEVVKWLKGEFIRLKDFLSLNMPKLELTGVTMQDGGNIVEGAVANINEEGIQNFEKEFLTL